VTSKHHKADSTAALKDKLQNQRESEVELSDAQKINATGLLDHPSYLELQSKLTEAEEKADHNWDRVLRIQADMDNMQRRVSRDIENAHKYGLEKFVLELLPIVDSLERATLLSSDQQHSVLEGVTLTLKMLYSAFEKFGIQQIDPLSSPFNPELHQAVSTDVDATVAPNTVLSVLQKGYLLNSRLIRPALVVVSKAS